MVIWDYTIDSMIRKKKWRIIGIWIIPKQQSPLTKFLLNFTNCNSNKIIDKDYIYHNKKKIPLIDFWVIIQSWILG